MNILYDIFDSIIKLTSTIYEFLFYKIEILDISFNLWQVLAGGFFTILFIAWLVKKLVPLA